MSNNRKRNLKKLAAGIIASVGAVSAINEGTSASEAGASTSSASTSSASTSSAPLVIGGLGTLAAGGLLINGVVGSMHQREVDAANASRAEQAAKREEARDELARKKDKHAIEHADNVGPNYMDKDTIEKIESALRLLDWNPDCKSKVGVPFSTIVKVATGGKNTMGRALCTQIANHGPGAVTKALMKRWIGQILKRYLDSDAGAASRLKLLQKIAELPGDNPTKIRNSMGMVAVQGVANNQLFGNHGIDKASLAGANATAHCANADQITVGGGGDNLVSRHIMFTGKAPAASYELFNTVFGEGDLGALLKDRVALRPLTRMPAVAGHYWVASTAGAPPTMANVKNLWAGKTGGGVPFIAARVEDVKKGMPMASLFVGPRDDIADVNLAAGVGNDSVIDLTVPAKGASATDIQAALKKFGNNVVQKLFDKDDPVEDVYDGI